MMRKPLVFSLVQEQSLFMTVIMSLLTFLAIAALGISLSISTGVSRWNNQWELSATVQSSAQDNTATEKALAFHKDKFASYRKISEEEMKKLLAPWTSSGSILGNYLPGMYEIKFNKKSDIKIVQEEILNISGNKFLPHSVALKSSTSAGWRMIMVSGFLLLLVLAAIGFCVSYIAKNTAMLHKRELEILNQIGAQDSFISRQMQIIVAKICFVSGLIGFTAAVPVLVIVLSAMRSAKIGLMSMMGLSTIGWLSLILMPFAIIIFSIFITKKTTLKILAGN